MVAPVGEQLGLAPTSGCGARSAGPGSGSRRPARATVGIDICGADPVDDEGVVAALVWRTRWSAPPVAAHSRGQFVDEPCGARGRCWPPRCAGGRAAPRRCRRGWPAADGSPGCGCSRRRRPACGRVHLAHRGVQVHGHRPITGSRPSCPRLGQELLGEPVELADVAEGERAEERPQGGGRHDPMAEHLAGGATAQQVGVVDAVPTRQHRVDQGQQLAAGPWPRRAARPGRSAGRRPARCPAARPAWPPAAGPRWPPRGCRRSRCRAGPGCGRIPLRKVPSWSGIRQL